MQTIQTQVAVVGGGIAGSLAAVAAARTGCRTLLIEEAGYLGGSLTACGTGPMMTFHAGNEQVVRGLGEELVSRLKKKGLSVGHIPDSTGYTYSVTPFDAEGMKRELELMVQEAGADLVYHASAINVQQSDGLLKSVIFSGCGQKFAVEAQVFIDATGDADLVYLAGVPYAEGRASDGKDQPMTMNFRIDGLNTDTLRRLMKTDRCLFPLLVDQPGLEEKAPRLAVSGMYDLMRAAMREKKITFDRDVVLVFEANTPGEAIVNMTRVNGEKATDPFSLSRAEIEGRRQVWELFSFLKNNVPGFEDIRLLYSGPSIGVRSSRRMRGCYTLTAQDVLRGTKFEDGIASYGYPVDVHSSDEGGDTTSTFLRWGDYYHIPYRCLINDSVPNLMAAGRNISASFEAQASCRTSPACCALGHAAGCAAALAVQQKTLPTALCVEKLQKTLREQGAFV